MPYTPTKPLPVSLPYTAANPLPAQVINMGGAPLPVRDRAGEGSRGLGSDPGPRRTGPSSLRPGGGGER